MSMQQHIPNTLLYHAITVCLSCGHTFKTLSFRQPSEDTLPQDLILQLCPFLSTSILSELSRAKGPTSLASKAAEKNTTCTPYLYWTGVSKQTGTSTYTWRISETITTCLLTLSKWVKTELTLNTKRQLCLLTLNKWVKNRVMLNTKRQPCLLTLSKRVKTKLMVNTQMALSAYAE